MKHSTPDSTDGTKEGTEDSNPAGVVREKLDALMQEPGGIHKFGEGVEMLNPTLCEIVRFTNESGRREEAFRICHGQRVERGKEGQPIISPKISFIAIASDDRFKISGLHLELFDSLNSVTSSCFKAVQDEAESR